MVKEDLWTLEKLIYRSLNRYITPLFGLVVFGLVAQVIVDPWLDIAIKRVDWRIAYNVIYYPSFTIAFLICMWSIRHEDYWRIILYSGAIGYSCGLAAYILMHFVAFDAADRFINTLGMHAFPLNYFGLLSAGLLSGGVIPGLFAGICVAGLVILRRRIVDT